MAGEAIDAYRRFQVDAAAHIRASGQWAGAMATGLQIASTIVQVVHDLVRDILSQLVGSAISWATQAVVTVGIATPWIVAQVSSRVASWTAKISSKLTGLLRSCGKLGDLLTELKALMDKGTNLLEEVPRRAPGPTTDTATTKPLASPVTVSREGDTGLPDLLASPQRAAPKHSYDVADPEQVRRASVHNSDSDTAMLGKWDPDHPELRYTTRAEEGGHTYFSIDAWDDVKSAQGLDDAQMFDRYNIPFLEDQVAKHKDIHFSHLPKEDGSALWKEMTWLRNNDYDFDEDTMTAVYVGE